MAQLIGKFENFAALTAAKTSGSLSFLGNLPDATYEVTSVDAKTTKAGKPAYIMSIKNGTTVYPTVFIGKFTMCAFIFAYEGKELPTTDTGAAIEFKIPETFSFTNEKGNMLPAEAGAAPVLSKHDRFRKEKGGLYAKATDAELDADPTFKAYV